MNKQRELEPHKKFRQASAWISDDADRLLLRIEARVFVGTVFVDLQSVQFAEKALTNLPNESRELTGNPLPAINRPAGQRAGRARMRGACWPGSRPSAAERFHVQPAICRETRRAAGKRDRRRRARAKFAIDPAAIKSGAGQQRLRADDHVSLQIRRRDFVGRSIEDAAGLRPRSARSAARNNLLPGAVCDGWIRRCFVSRNLGGLARPFDLSPCRPAWRAATAGGVGRWRSAADA